MTQFKEKAGVNKEKASVGLLVYPNLMAADILIYKFPRIILSVVVMGIILYLLLGFFSDKFDYNESWKFIYLFIIVIISLVSYLLSSNFSGAFKFKDIKLK